MTVFQLSILCIFVYLYGVSLGHFPPVCVCLNVKDLLTLFLKSVDG